MPIALEHALKKTAKKRGYSKERTGAYVYGTLRKTGWTPKHSKHKALKRVLHTACKGKKK